MHEEHNEEVTEMIIDDSLEEFDNYEEESKVFQKKIKRQVNVVAVATLFTLFARRFHKYGDFDIVQRSPIFITMLVLSVIATIGIVIYLKNLQKEYIDQKIYRNIRRTLEIFDLVSVVPVFLATMSILNIFMFSPASVVGASMEPNFHEGDDILIWHLLPNYERYDVIILKINEEDYYIKRIIGLPGDKVNIDENTITVNGVLLDQEFLKDEDGSILNYTYCDQLYTRTCNFTVPIDSYFVLGDNRENSLDSRYIEVGYVNEDQVMGKVIFHFNNIFK